MSSSTSVELLRDEHKLDQSHRDAAKQSKSIDHKGDIMSKIKDQMERDHELMMQMSIEFAEFLEALEPNTSFKADWDTDEEEEDSEKTSTPGTSIVPANTLKPANNISFNPKIGA